MKLKAIAAAALVASAAFSGSANAAFDLGLLDNTTKSFSETLGPGGFSSLFTFTLTNPGSASGFVEGFIGTRLSATVTGVSLTNTTGYSASASGVDDFSFSGLTSGFYTLTVFGNATGLKGGTIGGEIGTITSPVPEASTLALMMAGLGVVGFAARRRKAD